MRQLILFATACMLGMPVSPAALAAEVAPAARAGQVEVAGGGVGAAEEAALLAREKEFNLKLVFTLVEGNYVADVDVVVRDAKGETIVQRRDEGPLLLARLPEGMYTITAARPGKTIERKVKVVAGRLRTEYFRWPANLREDLPVSKWVEKPE